MNTLSNNASGFIKPPVLAPTATFQYIEPRDGFLHVTWAVITNGKQTGWFDQYYNQSGILIAEQEAQ